MQRRGAELGVRVDAAEQVLFEDLEEQRGLLVEHALVQEGECVQEFLCESRSGVMDGDVLYYAQPQEVLGVEGLLL